MKITIPGPPFSLQRPRAIVIGGHARFLDPKPNRVWKEYARTFMRNNGMYDAGTLLRLTVVCYFPCPKADERVNNPAKERWATTAKDADNLLKAVGDAGNEVLWPDDRQIVDARCVKRIAAQGENPRTVVYVSIVEPSEKFPQDSEGV